MKTLLILAVITVVFSSCEMPEGVILKQTWSFQHLSLDYRSTKSYGPETLKTSDIFQVESNDGQIARAVIAAEDTTELMIKSFKVMTEPFSVIHHNYPIAYTRDGRLVFTTLEPGN